MRRLLASTRDVLTEARGCSTAWDFSLALTEPVLYIEWKFVFNIYFDFKTPDGPFIKSVVPMYTLKIVNFDLFSSI